VADPEVTKAEVEAFVLQEAYTSANVGIVSRVLCGLAALTPIPDELDSGGGVVLKVPVVARHKATTRVANTADEFISQVFGEISMRGT